MDLGDTEVYDQGQPDGHQTYYADNHMYNNYQTGNENYYYHDDQQQQYTNFGSNGYPQNHDEYAYYNGEDSGYNEHYDYNQQAQQPNSYNTSQEQYYQQAANQSDLQFNKNNFDNYKQQEQKSQKVFDDEDEYEPVTKDQGAEKKLKGVMRTMNKLYDAFHELKIHDEDLALPVIVVCGSQSAGKTSVLENITGEEFLPRGADIQTRCPIVLQLVHTDERKKWVEFLHLKDKKFYDMQQVRNEIEKKNLQIADDGEVVSSEPITLKVFSPDVTNLTLVDLPGVVETRTNNQPVDLVQKIHTLVREHIENPHSIILAVSAATNDIVNSKSIRMAQDVDPNGERTLGVLTKLDLLEEGHEQQTVDVLLGRKIALRLGIVGVVNRSFGQLRSNMSLQDCIKHEKRAIRQKFGTCKEFSKVVSQNGTPFLISRVSDLLMKSIYEILPKTKKVLEKRIQECKAEKKSLGDVENASTSYAKYATKQINVFVKRYLAQIDGEHRNIEMDKLSTHAVIKQIFDDKLGKEMGDLDASKGITDKQIDNLMINSSALHSRNISPDDAFQHLAKIEIKRLEPIAMACAEEVAKQMHDAVQKSIDYEELKEHKTLIEFIEEAAKSLIHMQSEECKTYLKKFLNAESSFAWTVKGKFRNNADDQQQGEGNTYTAPAMPEDPYDYYDEDDDYEDLEEEESKSDNEKEENAENNEGEPKNRDENKSNLYTTLARNSKNLDDDVSRKNRQTIREEVRHYFHIAKANILEHVAKGVTCQLVYAVSDQLSGHMNGEATGMEIKVLSKPGTNPVERKKELKKLIESYKKAKELIVKVLSSAD